MMMSAAGIPLAVVGCDFRVAPSRARSQLVLDEHEALQLADELERGGWAEGLVVLDTCNRNEWIVASHQPAWAVQLLQSRMRQRLEPELRARIMPYGFVGDEAARHLFRVAIGQESLVVGERQISGQLFDALHRARTRGTSTRNLNGLGSIAGRLVRIAMRRGCLEASAVGVHSLAIAWLREQLPRGRARVVVVGLGSIGRRVAGILDEDPRFDLVRCNRTVEPGSEVRPLSELPGLLTQVDAAVFCTAAPSPLVEPELLQTDRALALVDIGIPEQVGEPTGSRWVRRVGLDQLVDWHQGRVGEGVERRCAVTDALVERALRELRRFCNEPVFAPVLEKVRGRSRTLMNDEVPAIIGRQLPQLSQAERGRLESELKSLLAGYTDETLQAIRDGARQLTEGSTWSEE
jgi:glutamyl-tRNA reductase